MRLVENDSQVILLIENDSQVKLSHRTKREQR